MATPGPCPPRSTTPRSSTRSATRCGRMAWVDPLSAIAGFRYTEPRSMMSQSTDVGIARKEDLMLSVEENERLTRVGPGTPMGELLRRYWYPIAVTSQFQGPGTRPVRLLGEDLVLYRDRFG